ncbi:hypothetical protein ABH925_003628 [Streptacidiphilus sp. EB129]
MCFTSPRDIIAQCLVSSSQQPCCTGEFATGNTVPRTVPAHSVACKLPPHSLVAQQFPASRSPFANGQD